MYSIFAVDMEMLPSSIFELVTTLFGLALVISLVHRIRKQRAREVPDLPSDEPAPDLRLPDPTPEIQLDQEPRS